LHLGTALTVLAGGVGNVYILVSMVLVILYFLDDLIEGVVEKLVSIFVPVHRATEEFIAITELVDESTSLPSRDA
jgi:hypothetical protein